MYQRFGKRLLDVLISILALCFMAAPMGLIALFVWIYLGPPVIFSQKRPGLSKKLFTLFKFRTMTDDYNARGQLLSDENRLTSSGRILRAASLDELPELFNVLRGDMSLVGPRPLLQIYLPLYSSEQARRMDVRPGITGWAQINGRNALDWKKRFELDNWYIDNVSFALDIRIILMTLVKVFSKEGISHDNHVTMPGFRGSADS